MLPTPPPLDFKVEARRAHFVWFAARAALRAAYTKLLYVVRLGDAVHHSHKNINV